MVGLLNAFIQPNVKEFFLTTENISFTMATNEGGFGQALLLIKWYGNLCTLKDIRCFAYLIQVMLLR